MAQSSARKEADVAAFGKVFGGVSPEFETPVTWKTDEGDVVVPFKYKGIQRADDFSSEKQAVFEAKDRRLEVIVRDDYSSMYGLRVRRQVQLHRKSGLLIGGSVEYEFGEWTAGLYANFSNGHFLRDFNAVEYLSDPTQFEIHITIDKSGKKQELPPLAAASYNCYRNRPVDIAFPLADYEDAIKGNYGIRNDSKEYDKTYFSWVNLHGALVGSETFGDGKPKVNESQISLEREDWTLLEGTAYEVKIAHTSKGTGLQRGRLRFSRRNEGTGEEWVFAVPAWMYNGKDFMRVLKEEPLKEFLSLYPVTFSVTRPDEGKIEVYTSSHEDSPDKS